MSKKKRAHVMTRKVIASSVKERKGIHYIPEQKLNNNKLCFRGDPVSYPELITHTVSRGGKFF